MAEPALTDDQVQDILALLRDCVVVVRVGASTATGFFVAAGQVLTCRHVIESAIRAEDQRISVTYSPGHKAHPGEELQAALKDVPPSAWPDAAILTVPGATDSRCVVLDSAPVAEGTPLLTAGYPAKALVSFQPQQFTAGFGGLDSEGHPMLGVTGDIVSSGISGSPVVNLQSGLVCGILVATKDSTAALGGFAALFADFIDQFPHLVALRDHPPDAARDWLRILTATQLKTAGRRFDSGARWDASAQGGLPPQETVFDFSADTPGSAGDVRQSEDQLGIEDDVRILCQLALARSTKPPLAIGLFGDWGTGKSFFMRRMQTRVREMQQEAKASLARGGTSPYCDNVVQAPFNAWHYVDSNLWASVMTRIFESLTESTSDKARDYIFSQLESTQGRLARARSDKADAWRQIDHLQQEQSALRRAQSVISGQSAESVSQLIDTLAKLKLPGDEPKSSLPEGVRTLDDLHEAAQGVRSTARFIQRLLDWWPFRLLLVTAVLVVLGGLGIIAAGGGDLVVRMLSVAAVVVPTVAAAAGVTWRRFRNVVDFASQADDVEQWITSQLAAIDERDRRLTSDVQRAQQQADQAVRTINSVRTGNLIRQYVEDRVTNDAYRDQLGVISLVRKDLQRLSELCSPTEDGPGVFSMAARFDIQRVMLYIDDLDRCPPDRVVEVLQAVHLLLAFPLFVVVVGVDSRWLITSLKIHYQRLLHDEDHSGQEQFRAGTDEWEASPADYLDKIFQIPLSLRPISDDGYRALVKNLMPVRAQVTGDEPDPGDREAITVPVGNSGEGTVVSDERPTGHAAQRAALQARERRHFALAGEPLAVRFVVSGMRLVVVTSAGIWILNLGLGATDDSREVTAQIQKVHFSPDGGRLMYETHDEWVVLDTATAAQAVYQRPTDALAEAVGEDSDAIVYATENELVRLCGDDKQSIPWPHGRIDELLIAEDRLVILGTSGLTTLWLPDLSDTRSLAGDELGTIVDMALNPRDRTLFTLHPDRICIWRPIGDNWGAASTLDVSSGSSYSDRLAVCQGGVLVRRTSDVLHVTSQRPAISSVEIAGTLSGSGANLSADPSTARFVLWSSPTVMVCQQEGTGSAELSRFEVAPVDRLALSPDGMLVATAGGGSYQLWYIGDDFVDEDISQLELTPEEAAFIATLGPVVPTARSAKRLVNVYRVLRASKVGKDQLSDPASDEYKVALLLLSLVTGWPHLALPVLRELENSTSETWMDLLDAVRNKQSDQDRRVVGRGPGRDDENVEILRAFQKLSEEAPTALDRYRAWAPEIRRFSIPSDDQMPS